MELGNTCFNFRGRYKAFVIDAETQAIVEERDWKPNLFLNQGMNGVATKLIASLNLTCCVGTGTTDTKLDSGATTASQTGTTVTASASIFVVGDVGNVVKWDSGEEAFITAFTNDTTVTVSASQTVSSGQFTVYRTNQTGLVAEVKRTNVYLTGSPNTDSIRTGNSFTNRRTFDFTAEVGSVTYHEVGLSDLTGAGANLNFRIKLDTPISLVAGQQLRIAHDFIFTLSPVTPVSFTPLNVTNWPVSPATNTNASFQLERIGLSKVNTTGVTTTWDFTIFGGSELSNEPSVNTRVWLSAITTPLVTWPTSTNGTASTSNDSDDMLKDAYVTNSFTLTKSGVLGTSNGNGTNRRSLGYGLDDSGNVNKSMGRFLFEQEQTKNSTQIFTLVMRWTWTRSYT